MSTRSTDGREWARVDDTRAGSRLLADGGFVTGESGIRARCISEGQVCEVREDASMPGGLYVECSHGRHYLDGQLSDGLTHYVGFWPA